MLPCHGGKDEDPPKLASEAHKNYIYRLSSKQEGFEHSVTEHLKMSGLYWGLCALDMLDALPTEDDDDDEADGAESNVSTNEEQETSLKVPPPRRKELVAWVLACQQENGGFGGSIGHDAHLLYTLSAVQVLAILGALDMVDRDRVAAYVASLQRPDGSFMGDEWGEVDTRFVYCALNCLSLLGRLPAKEGGANVNVEKAVEYLLLCRNFDGSFGCVPGAESHAGQTFTCIAALAIASTVLNPCTIGKQKQDIAGREYKAALENWVDGDQLGWWLCERQVENGGLNGRPEKLADVCYSWWVLSALCLVDRLSWIDARALQQFIIQCQDVESGGIADRPGDMVDVFHTFFGIGGLSLLGYPGVGDGGLRIDPAYALTRRTCQRLGLALPWDRDA